MTTGCDKGKYSIYCRSSKMGPGKNEQLLLKRLDCPKGLQGRIFESKIRDRVEGCVNQLVGHPFDWLVVR